MLLGIWPAAQARSQTPEQLPAPPEKKPSDVLPGLPRLPEQPQSLFLAPPPQAPPPEIPGPYFEPAPLLDVPPVPQTGWFADGEVNVVSPHVKNQLIGTVQINGFAPDTVRLPSSDLNWTVSPRFEAGYRFLSGYGECLFAYQFLASHGSETMMGPDGPAALSSRVDVQVFDFDYTSREISLWPMWEMRWFFGGRLANVYFDSRSEEPLAEAAAGTGVFFRRVTNHYIGFGPHCGLELERHLGDSGLSLVVRPDGWISLGRIRQGFFEESTTLGLDGRPLTGESHVFASQAVLRFHLQGGLSWRPPQWPNTHFFAGYQYEKWWNVGRESDIGSGGELEVQGVWLQAGINF
jgi:hypothetical protein